MPRDLGFLILFLYEISAFVRCPLFVSLNIPLTRAWDSAKPLMAMWIALSIKSVSLLHI